MDQDLQSWEERARIVAASAYGRLEEMGSFDLPLRLVDQAEATGTNSLDPEFLAALQERRHLNESFLAAAAD